MRFITAESVESNGNGFGEEPAAVKGPCHTLYKSPSDAQFINLNTVDQGISIKKFHSSRTVLSLGWRDHPRELINLRRRQLAAKQHTTIIE